MYISCTAPSDYIRTETELSFEPSEDIKMWTVSIVNDSVLEPTKFFYGTIAPSASSQGTVLLDRDATIISITDDDGEYIFSCNKIVHLEEDLPWSKHCVIKIIASRSRTWADSDYSYLLKLCLGTH